MYADDTTFECASTVDEVQIKLQNSINLAHRWFVDNRLIVNTKKSSVMLVGSPIISVVVPYPSILMPNSFLRYLNS